MKLLLNVAHWQAWNCSEGTMWASYAIQDRENVTCTAPEFLLNWCFDHCCSSRAALYPQVTRQTCAWTITGTPCVTATSLAVELGRRHTSVIFSAVAWAQHVGIYTAFMLTQPCSALVHCRATAFHTVGVFVTGSSRGLAFSMAFQAWLSSHKKHIATVWVHSAEQVSQY